MLNIDIGGWLNAPISSQVQVPPKIKLLIQDNDKYGGRAILLGSREPYQRTLLDYIEPFPNLSDGIAMTMSSFPQLQRPRDSYYRCCRCKYPLSPAIAKFSLTPTHEKSVQSNCTHVFLAFPSSWMADQIDVTSPGGKLYCPYCDGEGGRYYVGEYCWLGVQCQNEECAEIVAPGLALIKRLDEGGPAGVEFRQVLEDGLVSEESDDEGPIEGYYGSDDDIEEEVADDLTGDGDAEDDPTRNYNPLQRPEELFQQAQQPATVPISIILPPGHLLNHLRNPRHLPNTPSRLRNTWIPRSAPSSQASTSSDSGSPVDVEMEPFSNESSNGNVHGFDNQWLANLQASPDTPAEILEVIQEFLANEESQLDPRLTVPEHGGMAMTLEDGEDSMSTL